MQARAELELLLVEQFDGRPDPTRNRKLADLLRAHPEMQAEYLDQLQMHALLQWRGGKASPSAPLESEKAVPAAETLAAVTSRRGLRRGFAAALFITAASLAAIFVVHAPPAKATPDVVERLVDLNVSLAQLPTAGERVRFFDEQAATLTASLAETALAPAERELAETLLENGSWMAKNEDPMAEAERFNDIADTLVVHMDAAASAKDQKKVVKLARSYQRITDGGISPNLKRAATGLPDTERTRKLERTAIRQANRAKAIAAIVERSPEASRREIRRELKAIKAKKQS